MPATKFHSLADGQLILELWPRRGCPLLFYPGTMIEPGHYRLLLDKFFQSGFSVCALHLPGHGKNKSRIRDIRQFLTLGCIAEEWLQKNNKAPVLVCGHSQGGILALLHASESPNLAGCFAISAAFPQIPEAIHITRFGKFAPYRDKLLMLVQSSARFLPKMPIPLPIYLSGHRILAGRKRPIFIGQGKGRICYPLRFLDSLFNVRAKLPIAIPCWFFAARNDALFSTEISQKSFTMAKPPKGGIIWLEEGGHMAVFNDKIASFVASSCASQAAALGLPLILEKSFPNG